jgi:hypothetical protein
VSAFIVCFSPSPTHPLISTSHKPQPEEKRSTEISVCQDFRTALHYLGFDVEAKHIRLHPFRQILITDVFY